MRKQLLLFLLSVFSLGGFAQSVSVKGIVVDALTKEPLQGVEVGIEGKLLKVITTPNGEFSFNEVVSGSYVIQVYSTGYVTKTLKVVVSDTLVNLGTILLEKDITQDFSDNLITLTENDLDDDESGADVTSGLLQATRDIFLNRAAFDFGQAFFRVRGYDSQEAKVLINGIPMNKMFNGRPQWSNWGGLNDVTRNQHLSTGLDASDYTFGGVFGSTNITTRPSENRPGFRLSSSTSNRTYSGRLMATYNSGMQQNGIAYAVSASRRWAEEGYIDGTLYNAYSLFGAFEYKINDNHSISATGIFTPNRRGRSSSITEEVFKLKGRKYNPFWGMQEGDLRNSRMREIAEPIVMLTHYFQKDNKSLQTTVAYQFGKIGNTRLLNSNARNLDPTYYRNMPSYYLNLEVGPDYENSELARLNFLADPQLNWETIYKANMRHGTDGRSAYIISEDRTDDKTLSINMNYREQINQNVRWNSGLTFSNLKSQNFAEVTDLLGGMFFLDYDYFTNTSNDLGSTLIKSVGDKHSYNY